MRWAITSTVLPASRQGALARARRAEYDDEFSLVEREADTVERPQLVVSGFVDLRNVTELYDVHYILLRLTPVNRFCLNKGPAALSVNIR